MTMLVEPGPTTSPADDDRASGHRARCGRETIVDKYPTVSVQGSGHDSGPRARTSGARHAGRVRGPEAIVLSDGRVLYGTPIRDYDPDLTDEDYAALARLRDEIRTPTARTVNGSTSAA